MKFLEKLNLMLSNKHCKKFLFIFIIICWSPTFIAFLPGILNYDGPHQMVSLLINTVSSHHPIIHTLLLSFFYNLGSLLFTYPSQGLLLYTLFQMLIMAFIFSYATKFIYDSTKNVKLTILTLLFFAIFPTNVLLPLMTSKDVLFAGLVLLYIINWFKLMDKEAPSKSDYFALIIITILMLLFRNNAIYSFIISFPFWLLLLKKKSKLKFLSLFLLCVIIFFSFSSILMFATNAKKGSPKEKLSIITQAIGRISKNKFNNLTEEEIEKIDFYFGNTKNLSYAYTPYLSDKTKDLLDYNKVLDNKSDFYNFSLELIKKYPIVSLESFLATCSGYWNIFDNTFYLISNQEFPREKGYFEITFYNIQPDNYVPPNYLPIIKEFYISMFCENNYRFIPIINVIFQPAFYFYILVGYVMYMICTKNIKNLLPSIFLLAYFLTCFLGPCAIVRYIYCIIVCIPVLASKIIPSSKK